MSRTTRGWAGLLIVTLLVVAGCSRSPEAQKARHLERGDKFAAREQHQEAILEYRNVLRLDPANARAIRQLGLSHYSLGEGPSAFRYLLKAQQLTPDDHEVRLKLGRIYLLVGKREEAHEEAGAVLSKEPNNFDALALLADSSTSPKEVDATIGLLEGQRATLGDRAKFYLALGVLYFRKQDLPGAERAFQEAVAREPKSLEAHSLLGSLYLAKRDRAQAEREFKVAADLAPIGSAARLKLVDFYLSAQKPDEAKRILSEITQKAPDFLPAWRRLAQIAYAERNYDESLRALKTVLKKNPSDLDAHFLQGRVRLARHETTEAIQEFQQVLKLEPRHTPAHYELARAHLQAGNLQQAKAELREATSIAPNFVEATLLLADLNLQSGALQPAIEDLEKFVVLAAGHASVLQAHRLLGSAYLVKGEPVKATETFRKIVALAPKDPRGPYLVGMGLRAQGKSAQAKQEFEAAIALAPGYVEPLTQLVDMALLEKQPDAALNRVTKQIGLAPNSGGLQQLLGMLYLARRETRLAEGAFLKAIELEPRLIESYLRLGNLYRESGRDTEALAKFEEAVRVQPQNIGAQMLLAVLYEGKGEIAKAQERYERILALSPRFAPAANNLAWLYAEHGGDKEKALQLAQTAKEILPEDPSVSDTLGWILYQRGVYQRAASLLKESAGKLPDNPVIQYHLGMASLKVGDKEGARKALAAALNSPASFAGKEEARRALSELK
jgi:tetratricopeptide (TPR) repeat protein